MTQSDGQNKIPVVSCRDKWVFLLLVAILAIGVTAFISRPWLEKFDTHLAGFHGDAIEHMWTLWWHSESLVTLNQSPAQLDIITYPGTRDNPILLTGATIRTLTIPLVRLFGPIVAYNTHLFAAFVLTWVFMAWLILELSGHKGAAVAGGAIFTFSINRVLHAFYGHFTMAITYPHPLLVLSLWRLFEKPTIWRGVAFGGTLILASAIDLASMAHVTIPLMAAVLIYFLLKDRRRFFSRDILQSLGAGLGFAALILLPILWPLLSRTLDGSLDWYKSTGVALFSIDLLAPFITPPEHFLSQLWPALHTFSHKIFFFSGSESESVVYVGWITLLLAGFGIYKGWNKQHDIKLWAATAGFVFLLSLGPVLRVAGSFVTIADKPIILPNYLLSLIPFMAWGRTPARLHLTTMFALAILAAYGLSYVSARIKHRGLSFLFISGMLGLILLDSASFSEWPLTDVRTPAFIEQIAADSRPVAVMDIPLQEYGAAKYHLLYQITHRHTIVGGYSYRRHPDVVTNMRTYETFVVPGGAPLDLAQDGIAYIVLHRNYLTQEQLDRIIGFLTGELGAPVYDDDQIVAFTVPDAAEIVPSPLLGK